MLLIKNGYMIDPETGIEGKKDILIDEGKILKIAECGAVLCGKMPPHSPHGDVNETAQNGTDDEGGSDGEGNQAKCSREPDVIDAEGCVVAPGLVDVHVHFRDPGFTQKEQQPLRAADSEIPDCSYTKDCRNDHRNDDRPCRCSCNFRSD